MSEQVEELRIIFEKLVGKTEADAAYARVLDRMKASPFSLLQLLGREYKMALDRIHTC